MTFDELITSLGDEFSISRLKEQATLYGVQLPPGKLSELLQDIGYHKINKVYRKNTVRPKRWDSPWVTSQGPTRDLREVGERFSR